MHTVLEEEIRGRLNGLALRVRQYDAGVVLSAALCFVPLPPTVLVGLILTVFHLALARNKLSKLESSLLHRGLIVAIAYIVLWMIVVYWLWASGELQMLFRLARDWAAWLLQNIEPTFLHRGAPISSPLFRHA